MRRTLVLLDCDGPMANFVDGFLNVIEDVTGERYGAAVVTEWEITDSPFFHNLAAEHGYDRQVLTKMIYDRVNCIGFCAALKRVEGVADALERIRSLDVDVEALTSPLMTSPTWMPERAEWLKRLGFKKDQTHFVNSKHRVPGDFLLDDKPSHVGSWMEASKDAGWQGHGLLWHAPYNETVEDCGTRVSSWDEVCGIINERERLLRSPTPYSASV